MVRRNAGQGHWGGRTRTCNFPVNSRAVCQLTYTPSTHDTPGAQHGRRVRAGEERYRRERLFVNEDG